MRIKYKFLSRFYDVFENIFLFQPKRDPRKLLVSKLQALAINEQTNILDICSGTLNGIIPIATRHILCNNYAIDLSEDMLQISKHKIDHRKIDNIKLLQMDACRLGFRDNCFDVVTISFALHEMELDNILNILSESSRVLKENGKLYILDYCYENNVFLDLLLKLHFIFFEPRYIKQFMRLDWDSVLKASKLRMDQMEKCFFSKVIEATKI
jgi:ubiquinone/menaquinone biosynthesis C-methylase UbiE